MKTSLPQPSEHVAEQLAAITNVIRELIGDDLAMLILFGPYPITNARRCAFQSGLGRFRVAFTPEARRDSSDENHIYGMQTFIEWLSWLHLVETYYSFDAGQYNQLFDGELEKLIRTVSAPEHRAALERMRGFNWVGYIAQCVRNAGFHDQRQVQERTHDIVVKLVMGTLFRAFDERTSGPMDLWFKRSVANAVKNIVEKEKNRRRLPA